jgi:hypothetical protein
VLDGPYADTKERFHIIEVSISMGACLWAARNPTALQGLVEVGPLMNVLPSE